MTARSRGRIRDPSRSRLQHGARLRAPAEPGRPRRRAFRDNGVTGWVLADDPPWPGAIVDSRSPGTRSTHRGDHGGNGVQIRELPRTEVGAWADVIVAASDLPEAVAAAWRTGGPSCARGAPPSLRRRGRWAAGGCGEPAPAPPAWLAARRLRPRVTPRPWHPARADRASRGSRAPGWARTLSGHRPSTRARRQPTSSASVSGVSVRGAAIGSSRPDRRGGGLRGPAAHGGSATAGSGRVRRLACAIRSTPRSRPDDQPIPYCDRRPAGRVDNEMRCAASHASRGNTRSG